MKLEKADAVVKQLIIQFLLKHPDEIYTSRDIAEEFNLPSYMAVRPPAIIQIIGAEYFINDPVAQKKYFGCPEAISRYKNLAGLNDEN